MEERKFYVYMWHFKDTGEVFHIGKGTGDRYKEIKQSRNDYFKNIVKAHKDNVDVKIYKDKLTEEEAWDLEKQLIAEYKAKGQCKTNFHEGGRGGNTGNYDNPERSRKISEALKGKPGRKGKDNPQYGKHLSEETKKKISASLKGRVQLEEEKLHRAESLKQLYKEHPEKFENFRNSTIGRKMSEDEYSRMMDRDCPYEYQIFLNDTLIYKCLGRNKLLTFCKEQYNISRTIVDKVIQGIWKPTFNKHKHLSTLKILKIERCID